MKRSCLVAPKLTPKGVKTLYPARYNIESVSGSASEITALPRGRDLTKHARFMFKYI